MVTINDKYIYAYSLALATWDSILRSAKKEKETISTIIFRRYPITREQAEMIAEGIARVKK